jgi:hypothetical protein
MIFKILNKLFGNSRLFQIILREYLKHSKKGI